MNELAHGPEHNDAAQASQPEARGSGYPPQGQADHIAAIASAEAKDKSDPDLILAKLDSSETAESPNERKARLTEFITTYCSDLDIPKERMQSVITECQDYENVTRGMWADPTINIGREDAEAIRDKILALVPPIEEQRKTLDIN